jgi:sulfate transport system ATP-binding protein
VSIEVRDINKAFGDFRALDNVSVSIRKGSLTALLGPSGGGKSTLLRVIAGLEQPDTGQVMIEGRDVTNLPARQRGIGFVFQHYAAFTHMTVRDNVAFGLKVAHAPKAKIRAKVDELLALVHLNGMAHRYPSELSGGQRQRMALARALAVEPTLLLLDEPFGALDVKVREELRAWLRRLHDEVGATTVLVTHDQDEAMELADEIVVINEGRVEQTGPPSALYDHPANEFVFGFLGPVTRLGGTLVRPHDIDISLDAGANTTRAVIERVVNLGFETRIEARTSPDEVVLVQLTRGKSRELELETDREIHLRAVNALAPDLVGAGSGSGIVALGELPDE